MTTQKQQILDHQASTAATAIATATLEVSQMHRLKHNNSGIMVSFNNNIVNDQRSPLRDVDKEDEMSISALSLFRAKEEEIERKKMEVRGRVHAQLGRVEEATKRLAEIREELEGLTDPMRKEVSVVRKRIDTVNKELKPLGQSCQKKEREYKEALEAFNEKNKEKAQLISKLVELVTESERVRMKKLEDLNQNIENLR